MSKIKHYETMFILKPTLTDEETVVQIENIRAIIEKNGGEIASADNVGTRELAYEIERNYRMNENLIRFIFIKYDSKKEVASWTKMSDEAAKKANK